MIVIAASATHDLWGVAVPAWLGAAGTVGASVVAVVAYFRGAQARGGVQQLADGLNRPERQDAVAAPPIRDVTAHFGSTGTLSATVEVILPVVWTVGRDEHSRSRSRHLLTNTSEREVTLQRFQQADGGDDVHTSLELPAPVGPRVAVPFSIERSFASPSVIAVEVEWFDPLMDSTQSRTLYI